MAFLGVVHVIEWAKVRLSFIILQKVPVLHFLRFLFCLFLKEDVQNWKHSCVFWVRSLSGPSSVLFPKTQSSVCKLVRIQRSKQKSYCSHLNPNNTHPMDYIFHFGVSNTKIHTQKIQNVKCNLHIFFIKKYLLVWTLN